MLNFDPAQGEDAAIKSALIDAYKVGKMGINTIALFDTDRIMDYWFRWVSDTVYPIDRPSRGARRGQYPYFEWDGPGGGRLLLLSEGADPERHVRGISVRILDLRIMRDPPSFTHRHRWDETIARLRHIAQMENEKRKA